jgi:hypothetical protein
VEFYVFVGSIQIMFVIDYIWVQDVKKSLIQSQTSIVSIPEVTNSTLTNEYIANVPLLKLPNQNILRPVYLTENPFSSCSNSYIVLCDLFKGKDDVSNNRLHCDLTLTKHYEGTYNFDVTQHFCIDDPKFKVLKIDTQSLSVGNYFSHHREFTDKFLNICLQLGISITHLSSKNLNQWMYTVSSVMGTEAGDIVWITRYLLYRLSESYQFQVKINNLVIALNDISNNSKFNTDPYLTLSVMVSTIHKVKSKAEIEKLGTTKSQLTEQLTLKNSILEESEILQLQLEETYNIAHLEKQELHELEKLNRMKEHQQYINKIRHETRIAEDERIERESRIHMELIKRKEREEQEMLLLSQEEEELSRLEHQQRIEDAELSRMRLLKEEKGVAESKKKIHGELAKLLQERKEFERLEQEKKEKEDEDRLSIEIQREEKELLDLEAKIEEENERQKQIDSI